MRYFIISEEDLKDFIRTSKRFGFACESVLYCPSEEELEVTEENLKRFKELKGFKGLNEYTEEPEEPEELYGIKQDFKYNSKEKSQEN